MHCWYKPASGSVQITLPNYFEDGPEIQINGAIGPYIYPTRNLACGDERGEFGTINIGIIERNKNPILKHSMVNLSGWPIQWLDTIEGAEAFFANWNKSFIFALSNDPRDWESNGSIFPNPTIARVDSPCGYLGNDWSKLDTGAPWTTIGMRYGSAHPPYDYFENPIKDFRRCTAIFRRDLKIIDCYAGGEKFGEGECNFNFT